MKAIETMLDGQSLVTPSLIAAEVLSPYAETLDVKSKSVGEAQLALILNLAQQQIDKSVEPAQIHANLGFNLHELRAKSSPALWQHLIPLAQNHQIADYFLQDPFTRWSYVKPRGYSGDAQLIDFIYGHPSLDAEIAKASPIGLQLYETNRHSPASIAVRERRDLLTQHIDEIAATRGKNAEILTIAAGHLREADRSRALQQERIKRWVVLDQDPLSVGSVRRDFSGTCIEAVDGSVRSLLTNAHDLGTFDLVYAAGLYDYLNDKVSIKLTRKCLQMLKPNGVFIFANFAENIIADGFMETFMNWALLLRTEQDMWRIIHNSAAKEQFSSQIRFGANRNIVYGFIRKLS